MDLVTRVQAEPGPHGCRPDERPIETHLSRGIVAVDKPVGPTSHQVSAWVREIADVDKAGHGGTLDPKVSGVLPVGLAEATKVAPLVGRSGKTYVGLMRLHDEAPRRAVEKALSKFTGQVTQTPPKKAAVKREPREREVYRLRLLEHADRDVLFEVACEAGTYVRTLVEDMGESLGVGAHMAELRRTRAGPFDESDAVTLQDLLDAYVFWTDDGDEAGLREVVDPLEAGLADLPRIEVRDSAVDALCHGAPLAVPGVVRVAEDLRPGQTAVAFTLKGEAVCWGTAKMTTHEVLDEDQGVVLEPDRVLMRPGTYAKGW